MAMLNNQRVSHNDAPNSQMWRVAYIWASATGRSITKSGPNPPKRSSVGLASPMGTLEVGVGVENSSGIPKIYGVLFPVILHNNWTCPHLWLIFPANISLERNSSKKYVL